MSYQNANGSSMRITASHIIEWAKNHAKEAQNGLPGLVRRLCFDPETTREISFPAGDSTYRPGSDGVLSCERGNAWMPNGASRWEIGCDQNPTAKANKDYQKRTNQTGEEKRSVCTFVFVTPRRWKQKSAWATEQRAKGEWKDVRALDADDLEQWLEQTPAVSLQFAEELGLRGPGVETLSRHWNSWSGQCNPAITSDALFMDRTLAHDELTKKIQNAASQSAFSPPLAIRADSVEEGAAFAVAVVLASGLRNQALVVTEPEGWRYVEANPQLGIAIAANTETAAKPVSRDGLLVIVPYATGHMVNKSLADKPQENQVVLERPNIHEFEKALIAMGMEESDAKRHALNTGRSWTVFRRRRATNPAIRHPIWLNAAQSSTLALVCLLGVWNEDNEADREVIEQLANRSYEEVEHDLRQLAGFDDAPVLHIGFVWKAKSPLELLALFGNRITRSQLDRFFAIAEELLSKPDPQLELPNEKRWMANIHGKVHPYSDLLFNSICDSLIKLAVRGPEAGLDALRVEARVSELIRGLFDGVDGQRWLSLTSHLPALAEAAPEEFLDAVEKSLRQPDAPVMRLITETGDSGFSRQCWHCDLLWALETLAWAPKRLARVALILADLSHAPIKGNWGNTPSSSLFGLFRSWLPQTAADLPDRIQVLDRLIEKDEEAAFDVLSGLASDGQQIAMPAARPKWGEDDAGAGRSVTYAEMVEMIDVAKDRLLQLSKDNPSRIAALLRTGLRHPKELPAVLALMEPFTQPTATDADKETLCVALRKHIHWHRNYDKSPANELDKWLRSVEALYERLSPQDLVVRHRWLFDKYRPNLPARDRDDDSRKREQGITQLRISALTDIHRAQGMTGIENLIATCAQPNIVGNTLAEFDWSDISWPKWIALKGDDFVLDTPMARCISGFLWVATLSASSDVLQKVIALGRQAGWDSAKLARFLILVKVERKTWELAKACGPEVYAAYWQNVQPDLLCHQKEPEFVLERLLESKRPRTALLCCTASLKRVSTRQLYTALQQFLYGEEPDGPQIESYSLAEMLEWLEKSGEIENRELIQLEFALFPALGYGNESRITVLYERTMSEPALFTELICLLYKPERGERETSTETTKAAAERAWKILRACDHLPGIQADGSIDGEIFAGFIDQTRELCRRADRLAVCDSTLGQILAHALADQDGAWSCAPVREVLDRAELEEMQNGFSMGTFNKRGVATYSLYEGGNQERDLAAWYRKQATRVQYSHTNVVRMLEGIVKYYEECGESRDEKANLTKEEC
uniref:Uncharacterized protein n=1 Tax=Candidatus Kentrum sp. MB TaxID=2138164 RepID=A0A451BCC6_9GAMM|nr:MAG: hypothetical protein BECKMB1821I_GA0114274_10334 [Candidatus Kentron sp. MB]VFK75895.1 MAG: hypothetical protein BECKMB1821H_GA0114242_10354 [Candidatus Kentron sp. MB]